MLRIDVNGDDFPEDATRTDAVPPDLAGVELALSIRSTDIDRSDATTPADLLEEIDLLLGVGAYDPFDGASLPWLDSRTLRRSAKRSARALRYADARR
ncbi:MAG: hypothetical protein V1790_11085 [Planctomycetota bacterium]